MKNAQDHLNAFAKENEGHIDHLAEYEKLLRFYATVQKHLVDISGYLFFCKIYKCIQDS